MTQIKTADATGAALDWLVAKANSFSAEDASFFERPSGTAPGTSGGLAPATV